MAVTPDTLTAKKPSKFSLASQIFYVRINGKQTSVSVPTDAIALWLLMTDCYSNHHKSTKLVAQFIKEQVLPRWNHNTAKGLGFFVQICMLRSYLSVEDFKEYRRILKRVGAGK